MWYPTWLALDELVQVLLQFLGNATASGFDVLKEHLDFIGPLTLKVRDFLGLSFLFT